MRPQLTTMECLLDGRHGNGRRQSGGVCRSIAQCGSVHVTFMDGAVGTRSSPEHNEPQALMQHTFT